MAWMDDLAKTAVIAKAAQSTKTSAPAATSATPASVYAPTTWADDVAKINALTDSVGGPKQTDQSKNPMHMIADGSTGVVTSILGDKLGNMALKVPLFYGVSMGDALGFTKTIGTIGAKFKKVKFW